MAKKKKPTDSLADLLAGVQPEILVDQIPPAPGILTLRGEAVRGRYFTCRS